MASANGRQDIRIDIALLHYPVLNKAGDTIASAVTPLDLHDIARAARTYGARRFFVVTPLADQQDLVREVIDHWVTGYGATYNPTRRDALKRVELADTLDAVVARMASDGHGSPVVVVTSSRGDAADISYAGLKKELAGGRPHLLVFGTAWGLAPEMMAAADLCLAPIRGGENDYNHLSVRSAATAVLDRLMGLTDDID